MDALSDRAKPAMREEARAAAALLAATGLRYVNSPKQKPAPIDAVIVSVEECDGERVNTAVAVAEMKCRSMTLQKFREDYRSELLITFPKLVSGSEAAKLLRVPFWVLLWLPNDAALLRLVVADDAGEFVAPFRAACSITTATINGGTLVRQNAYLDFGQAERIG